MEATEAMSDYTEAELRRAFDEGVDEGDRGFADQPVELDIAFRVLLRHIAIRRENQRIRSTPGEEQP